jgi:hypothetical protein
MKSLKQLLTDQFNTTKPNHSQAKAKAHTADVFDFIQLIQKWEEIVGKLLAKQTRPQKLIKSTLVILTKHSTYSAQLHLMSPIIIEKINQHFPMLNGKISQLRFNVFANDYEADLIKQQINQHNKKEEILHTTLHPFSPEFMRLKKSAEIAYENVEDEKLKEMLINLHIQCGSNQ